MSLGTTKLSWPFRVHDGSWKCHLDWVEGGLYLGLGNFLQPTEISEWRLSYEPTAKNMFTAAGEWVIQSWRGDPGGPPQFHFPSLPFLTLPFPSLLFSFYHPETLQSFVLLSPGSSFIVFQLWNKFVKFPFHLPPLGWAVYLRDNQPFTLTM